MVEFLLGLLAWFQRLFGCEVVVNRDTPGYEGLSEQITFVLKNPLYKKVLSWGPFREWLKSLDFRNLELKSIAVRDLYEVSGRILFACFEISCVRTTDQSPVVSYIFMRGGSVAVLLEVVNSQTQEKYFALVRQARLPIGSMSFIELPAGMLDDGNFRGMAVKELREELGIELSVTSLESLGSAYPSPGGCDERINIFFASVELGPEKINEMLGKNHGNAHEGESIQVVLMTLKKIEQKILTGEIQDGKILSAMCLYSLRQAGH